VQSVDDIYWVTGSDSIDLLHNWKNDLIEPIQNFEHRIPKRTIRIPKTRYDDLFMDLEYCKTGSIVKLENPLILVHQNIRGIASKTDYRIGSFRMHKINPQLLCCTEHHMSDKNLWLFNTENYVLGSNLSQHNYQTGGGSILIRKDTCYSCLDLSKYYDEKKTLEICAVQLGSTGKQLIVKCVDRAPSANCNQFIKLLDMT
jgi:hypothetical protein